MSAEKKLPDGWEVKKLGDVCELLAGGDVPKDDFSEIKTQKHQFPIYANGEKNNGLYGFTSIPRITKPSITVSARGTIGFSVKRQECFYPVVRLIVITPMNPANLDLSFLHYSLNIINFKHSGTSIPQLTVPMISEYQINLPPIAEQKRIVSILDEAFQTIDRAKENAEKNLANAREVFDGYLNQVFSNPGKDWEEKRLGEIAQHSLGKMLDKAKNKGEFKEYLRNLNVRWFSFDLSDMIQMRFTSDEIEKYTARRGDVLVCEGGYPGRAAIWDNDSPIYFQKAIHRVRFENPILNKWFIYHLYLSEKNSTLKSYISGAGIQHFTGESLDRYVLPIAPDHQIITFVSKLDSLYSETSRLESLYQQKIAALDELKKSILQKAFSGEL
jgi:type I restriction enzyme S subunit